MIAVIKNIEIEALGLWEEVLREEGYPYRYFEAYKDEFPSSTDDYTHLVVLGGPQSANDDSRFPYIKRELELIERFIRSDKPVLGVCLGAQLIARVLGARVYKGPVEIGWFNIELTRPALIDYLFAFFPKRVKVFQFHDETFDLPHSCVRLASSNLVPNQAFKYGRAVYGLQFHLEITPTMIHHWREYYRDYLAERKEFEIPSFVPDGTYFPLSWEFFRRFIQLPYKEE